MLKYLGMALVFPIQGAGLPLDTTESELLWQLALPAIIVLASIYLIFDLSRKKPMKKETPLRRFLPPPYLSREEFISDVFDPEVPIEDIMERARYLLVEYPRRDRKRGRQFGIGPGHSINSPS